MQGANPRHPSTVPPFGDDGLHLPGHSQQLQLPQNFTQVRNLQIITATSAQNRASLQQQHKDLLPLR